jgi:hypothetical protein
MQKRRMFNKYKSKNQNGKGIKIYTMEDTIITFGTESLILEMFPESIPDPLPEPLEPLEPLPDPLEPLPEPLPKPLDEPVKKGWCVLS